MTDAQASGAGSVSFDLARFEQLARLGDSAALPALWQILDLFEMGADLVTSDDRDPESKAAAKQYRRLANAVASFLASPKVELSLQDCDWLAYHNRHLAAVFRMAWTDGPDRVFRHVRDAHSNYPKRGGFRNVLAAYSVAVSDAFDWNDAFEREPDVAMSFYLASFTHRTLIDEVASRRRDALFALAPQIARAALRESALPVLSAAWMLCSYATAPERHALKPHLNHLIQDLFTRNEINSATLPSKRVQETRPTAVVVAEVLLSSHAIYKTYVNFLRQLGTCFRVVLVTKKTRVDETASALFDETIAFEPTTGVREISDKIKSLSPALIYYPSIGISEMAVLLCNLRLAPVQIASVGHPATTHSPSIDYMVMGHEYYDAAANFSEQVMLLRSGGALFDPGPYSAPEMQQERDNPNILRVAIPSSPMKISESFLSLCKRVAERSCRAVEFCFFHNAAGLRFRDCRLEIERCLPNAVVFPKLDFNTYRDRIGRCDVYFGTYPFAGANTAVDIMLQGLPPIVFEGTEPHSRTDKRFVHLFGLPEWLIARSVEEYEQAALRLIQNDEELCAIARQILHAKPQEVLFLKEQSAYPTDFVDTVWWLYLNHESVKASDRRVWTWDDRQAAI